MKVGTHASEELSDIIGRKRAEIEAEGMAFWGYGGGTCHPSTMVRPFAMGSTGPDCSRNAADDLQPLRGASARRGVLGGRRHVEAGPRGHQLRWFALRAAGRLA